MRNNMDKFKIVKKKRNIKLEVFKKFQWMPRYFSSKVFNIHKINFTKEDLEQELNLALWRSIKNYFSNYDKLKHIKIGQYCFVSCKNAKGDFIGRINRLKRDITYSSLSNHEITNFEDFYNDKGRFPTSSEICYDTLSGDNTCHICGKRATSATMQPYSEKLACDPQSPAHDYLYQVDNDTSPSYYRIYAKLTDESDQAIFQLDCQFGCGPPPTYGYNYGVTSTNTFLETHMVKCDAAPRLYAVIGNICNICGSYSQCKAIAGNGATFYYNPEGGAADCSVPCKP